MDTKKLGLDIQINLFKFFFDSEYMHYGFWTPGLEVKAPNFKQAQENFTRFLIKNIPVGTKSILDIGCGSGKVAEELIQLGYSVTCVSPPSILTEKAVQRLAGKADVHTMRFEDFTTDEKFDLCLFSESYQYIDMSAGFIQCQRVLKPGGHILLADFFRTEAEGKSPLGGGHLLAEFYDLLKQQPFDVVEDQDITEEIAPTMTLINNLTMDVVYPAVLMVGKLIKSRSPLIYKFLLWKYKKKIEKNRVKHFTGQRNPENFKKYKSYRLVVLKKR
ncbi:MAG: class I SAM-dependent methyltransferase [Cyclobacteriaceae bacterium]|nr:class I SAM-dependent methyltransferase [Cyclobacteriaceae bacterium]